MIAGTNIEPAGFYDDLAVKRLLDISEQDQKKGRDFGDLKYTKKGRQILYRGQWLIDWLQPEADTP